jgi:tetratricopeptide (TPR) repeat protein
VQADALEGAGERRAHVDPLERAGARYAQERHYPQAVEAYKRGLLLLSDTMDPRRVPIYVKLGSVSRALGKPHVAKNCYGRALAIAPLDVDAYQGLVEVLLAERDFEAIDLLMHQRMAALGSDDDRVATWRSYATLWLDHAKDARRGLAALHSLLELRPRDPDALGRFASVLESIGQIGPAVDAYEAYAPLRPGPEAARVLRHAADLALGRLGDRERAAGFVERALGEDPDAAELLEMAEALLHGDAGAPRLAAIYRTLLDKTKDANRELLLAKKLGGLAVYVLQDFALAERALARAQVLEPGDAEICRTLAAARATQGAYVRALATCRAAVVLEPRAPSSYRIGLRIFEHMGSPDGAYCTASVLECLGTATLEELAIVKTHRPDGLLAVESVLGDADWQSARFFAERDVTMHDLVGRLSVPAEKAKLEVLRRASRPTVGDLGDREDLSGSTAMMVRALLWASQLLSIQAPDLYLCRDVPGDILAVPTASPSVRASRALGSGVTLKELAFLWGRALSVFRPEHYLAVFYPTVDELATLLEAASLVTSAQRSGTREALVVAEELDKLLPRGEREAIAHLLDGVGDLHEASRRWLVAYELSATRAGLLCAGDLAEAVRLVQRFPFGRVTTQSEQVDDLFVYCVGEAHLMLRRQLGVAARPV